MSYNVEILKDSIANDQRITTVELTFPRFILAEVNTHRMFSRNSASSRAIPTEKIIERVQNEPFIPETFNKRVKGMGVGEPLEDQKAALDFWLWSRDYAVMAGEELLKLDVDKSRVNRLLEPFMWHTAIVTATDWDNFFALRDSEFAQPEFQIIAHMLREQMDAGDPVELYEDEWHLPLVNYEDEFCEAKETRHWEYWAWVSAGRCARSSYDKIHDAESKDASYARAEKLKGAGHMSPFEHQARPFSNMDISRIGALKTSLDLMVPDEIAKPEEIKHKELLKKALEYSGNFRYWHQFRKSFDGEDNYQTFL